MVSGRGLMEYVKPVQMPRPCGRKSAQAGQSQRVVSASQVDTVSNPAGTIMIDRLTARHAISARVTALLSIV